MESLQIDIRNISKEEYCCPGIYIIICLPLNYVYVGQSLNINRRLRTHLGNLRKVKTTYSGESLIKKHFSTYGEKSFNFLTYKLSSIVDRNKLLVEEFNVMQKFRAAGYKLYNRTIARGITRIECPRLFRSTIETIIHKLESEKVSISELNNFLQQLPENGKFLTQKI